MTSAVVGGAAALTLRYDGRGRLQRTSGGGVATNYYVYDGDQLVAEYTGSGNVRRRFVHGAGVDDPVVWFEGSGTAASNRRYLHADERGSIVAVTDSAGAITTANRYDDWGIPATANIGRFGYTGQIWLSELGMNYYKARMYSPTLGRFMQTDPIGYEDGMNMYAYVRNDPMNASDPRGTQTVPRFLPLPLPGAPVGSRDRDGDGRNDLTEGAARDIEHALGRAVSWACNNSIICSWATSHSEINDRSDAEDRIVGDADPDRTTDRGRNRIFDQPPTGESAEEIFEDIAESDGVEVSEGSPDRNHGSVGVARLPDGSRVIDRNSRTGPRTIQVQDRRGRSTLEVRVPRDRNR